MKRKQLILVLAITFLIVTSTILATKAVESYSAWVCLGENNQIRIINSATFQVENTINISLGSFPLGVAFTPDGKYAYVVCRDSNNVVVVDAERLTEEISINVGNEPFGIRISHDGARAYVTNSLDDSLSTIDTYTNTVVNTIKVGDEPLSIDISPDDSQAYICLRSENKVAVVKLGNNPTVENFEVGNRPWGIALSQDGRIAYATCEADKDVWVIRLSDRSITAKIGLGGEPRGVAVSPNGMRVFAAYNQAVAHIDPIGNQKIDASGIHAQGWGLAVTPDNVFVLATTGEHTGREGVEVIDIARMEKIETIFLGEDTFGARGIAIRPVASGKILTSISCQTELQVNEGEAIVVRGSISPPLDGKTVELTFKSPNSSESKTTTLSLSDGSYSVTFEPDGIGVWEVQASWGGDEAYKGATSSFVKINYGVSDDSINGPGPFFLLGAIIAVALILVAVFLGRRKKL